MDELGIINYIDTEIDDDTIQPDFSEKHHSIVDIYKNYDVSETVKMSSSLKFCVLAAGEADIYAAQARAFEWDIAAGHAILVHAGGQMTTLDENKFSYGKKNLRRS